MPLPGAGARAARQGDLRHPHAGFPRYWGSDRPHLEPTPVRGEHNHSALMFGDRFFLKLFRKVEHGRNPELEVEQFLVEAPVSVRCRASPGWLEYRDEGGTHDAGHPAGEGASESSGWQYTMDRLGLFFERALAGSYDPTDPIGSDAFPFPCASNRRHPW